MEIGNAGVEYLANALQLNNVKKKFHISVILFSLFTYVDTYQTRSG